MKISPSSGLIEPVEDVHQRALAGAVFSQQGVDLPLLQGQVDVVVGQHAGETFGDVAQLENWGHEHSVGRARGNRHGAGLDTGVLDF